MRTLLNTFEHQPARRAGGASAARLAGVALAWLTAAPAAAQVPVQSLPIEVFGANGTIREVTLDAVDPRGVTRLELLCHRCAYRDASVEAAALDTGRYIAAASPSDRAKASVQVNNGPWLPIKDGLLGIEVDSQARSYGGIAGGYHTVGFSLPIGRLKPAGQPNTVRFRFNGTDGITGGFRILNIRLLAGTRDAVDRTRLVEDDPTKWSAPRPGEVYKGSQLWAGTDPETKQPLSLLQSPLSTQRLATSCSSCHAADGRDLKYFNYSNLAIIERSVFHGLNRLQGEQIASYIRSRGVRTVPQARPWNPPYQPAPRLDARALDWAPAAV